MEFNTLDKYLYDMKKVDKKGIHYIYSENKEHFLSYSELLERSQRVAWVLREYDYQCAIMQVSNIEDYIIILWGCILAGIAPMPLKTAQSTEDFERIGQLIKMRETVAVITDTIAKSPYQFEDKVLDVQELYRRSQTVTEKEKVSITAKDIALIQFSSGSTGVPKGVAVSHENIMENILAIQEMYHMDEKDTTIDWIPMSHNFGLIKGHLTSIVLKNDEYIMPTEVFITDPLLLLKKIQEYKVKHTQSPNFGIELLLKACRETTQEFDLSCVKSIIIGSDMVSNKICKELIEGLKKYQLSPYTLSPGYGLSEATVAVSASGDDEMYHTWNLKRNHLNIGDAIEVLPDWEDGVSFTEVGKIMKGVKVRICDDKGQALKERHIGNILVSGKSVAMGYFVKEGLLPLQMRDGWLETGDIGFVNNQHLTITGRKKDIMIVNGKNLYPSDFVHVIAKNTGIQNNHIFVWGNYKEETGQDEIIVSLEKDTQGNMDYDSIQASIKRSVRQDTGYDIAGLYICDRFKRFPNGKINADHIKREYLNQLQSIKDKEGGRKTEQGKDSEEKSDTLDIMEMIRKIIQREDAEQNDSICDFAVSSLDIIKIINKVNLQYNVNLGIREWLDCERFIDFIDKVSGINRKEDSSLQEDNKEQYEEFDLTNIQRSYFLGRASGFELGNTSTHVYFEMKLNADLEKYNQSLQKVIKRHPMLRTVLLPSGKQRVLKQPGDYRIKVIDVQGKEAAEKERARKQLRDEMSNQIFELQQWPLFNIKALQVKKNGYVIHFSIDMLIADSMSILILLQDLEQFYNGDTKEELTFTFKEYMEQLKEYEKKEAYSTAKRYWQTRIREIAPAPRLPLRKKMSEVSLMKTRRKSASLDRESWGSFRHTCEKHGIRPTIAFMTAFAHILSRWSNQAKLTLNMTLFNRIPFHEEVDDIVGDFTTLLLQEADLSENSCFWKTAQALQNNFLEAFPYRVYDGVNVIRDYAKYHGLDSTAAVMPVVFTSMLYGNNQTSVKGAFVGQIEYILSQTSQALLDHQILETKNGVILSWDYIEELFDEEVIEEMFSEYYKIIQSIGQDAKIILSEPNLEAFYQSYNHTEQSLEDNTLQRMFDISANRYSDRPCLKWRGITKTYREVEKESDRIAAFLRSKNIGKGSYVPILTRRRMETVISIVGILKTGAAYVPINEGYPEDRIKYICNELYSGLLIDEAGYDQIMQNYEPDTKNIYDNVNDSAYIIYTSGSTGHPKGVEVTHKAVCNTIQDINERFGVNQNDKIIGLSSMSFDLSVYDIFGAFQAGAELVLIDNQRDVEEIDQILRQEHITIWNSVPMIMEMFMEFNSDKILAKNAKTLDLRLVMLSGDWIPVMLPQKINQMSEQCRVISLGGATEASIWSIYYPVDRIEEGWSSIPYGYPLANQSLYILDYKDDLCPVGLKGDLYIGGKGLAKQYYRDEEKTSLSFVEHKTYGRIYKTGDCGIMHRDGYIEFMGREDSQVKIQGYRVELGEIEKCIREFNKIKNAVVLHEKNERNGSILKAYIVPAPELDVDSLVSYMKTKLPDYMIPAKIYQLDEIPMTSNGKVDRKELSQRKLDNLLAIKEMPPEKLTKTEEQLIAIWKELIGDTNVNIKADFMQLGGNSLVLVSAFNKIRENLYENLSVSDLFKYKNILDLAKFIDANTEEIF